MTKENVHMFVKRLNKNHLKDVAELEKAAYPEELCLGYEDYLEDFLKLAPYKNYSLGVFQNGELKAYIISYRIDQKYYVSDLVCLNPVYLLPLLLAFGNKVRNKVLTAEFRDTSYRMMLSIMKKYPTLVEIISVEKEEGYYLNGEDMYQIRFEVKIDNLKQIPNPRLWIMREIYSAEDFQVNIYNIIYQLIYNYNMNAEEIMAYKTFILRHVHYRNLDSLRMLGDTFRYYVCHSCNFKSQKAYNTMKEYLVSKGYTEPETLNQDMDTPLEDFDNKMCFNDYRNYLEWFCVGELDTKFKDDTISYYRSHLKRKFIQYFRKKQFVFEICIFDKYGDEWVVVQPTSNVYHIIPRNFRNLFDAYLKKFAFHKKIQDEALKDYPCYEVDYLISKEGILSLRKLAGEDVAYAYFRRVMDMAKNSDKPGEILHDWGFVIYEVLSHRAYLTKGAIKHIFLNKSLNQINKIRDALAGLEIDNAKYLDVKALRKDISKAIRKDEDIAPIVTEAVRETEAKWLKSKRISKRVHEEMLSFIEKMKYYVPQISINQLFRFFGTHAVAMAKGAYEGYFKEATVYPDYREFGQYLLGIMEKRTRRIERLYSALNKIQNINDIFEGRIEKENWNLIMTELKQRRVEIPEEFTILDRFHAKVEHKCSPEYLIAGNASVCCMSFGQEKAVTYALEKGFGIINIYYKDRVIGNSVIWVNEPYNCLVLDNIEIHPNYTRFNEIAKKLFEKTVLSLLFQYQLDFAVQGRNYNDLKLYADNEKHIMFEAMEPVMVEQEHFYSDARYVYPLAYGMSSEEAFSRIQLINQRIKKERIKKQQTISSQETGWPELEELAF